MSSSTSEHDGTQWDDHNISGIRCHIGHDTRKYNDRGKKSWIHIKKQLLQAGIDKTRPFSNANSQHGNQHGTQRSKSSEVLGGTVEDVAKTRSGEHILSHNGHVFSFTCVKVRNSRSEFGNNK